MISRILKDPLLHFLVLGAALFALYFTVNPKPAGDDRQIVVGKGQLEFLAARFARVWNRPPSRQELEGMVDDYVTEEIYYREALALGLDRNDAVIRKRLRQKMEFFGDSAAALLEPDDAALEDYLRANAERYRRDDLYSFRQVYFSTDRPATELDAALKRAVLELRDGARVDGDSSLLGSEFDHISASQVERNFGTGFAKQLDKLTPGRWSEPLRSGLGIHFVYLEEHIAGEVPPLAEIRDQVKRDWTYQRSQQLKAEFRDKLRAEYEVEIQWPESGD